VLREDQLQQNSPRSQVSGWPTHQHRLTGQSMEEAMEETCSQACAALGWCLPWCARLLLVLLVGGPVLCAWWLAGDRPSQEPSAHRAASCRQQVTQVNAVQGPPVGRADRLNAVTLDPNARSGCSYLPEGVPSGGGAVQQPALVGS